MSALPPKADMVHRDRDVRFVPKAAVSNRSKQRTYSITSSASASSVGGTASPSALAVFILMIS